MTEEQSEKLDSAELNADEESGDVKGDLELPKTPNAGISQVNTDSPSSSASTNSPAKDSLFEPSIDQMVNDFDDERTLEEEEELAAKEHEDPNAELDNLQKESDMPIEELLALYSIPPPSSTSGKKRKRKPEKSPKKQKKEESDDEKSPSKTEKPQKKPETPEEELDDVDDEESATKPEDSLDNLDENDDDTTNCEEDEASELKKLYAENYDKKGSKIFRSLARPDEEDEEDVEYLPEDDDDAKKTIMVGSDYQAKVPEGLCQYDDAKFLPYENEDKQLWDPSKMSEEEILEYLVKSTQLVSTSAQTNGNSFLNCIPINGKQLRDDEQALFLLLQCGYNSEEALRRRRINVVPSSDTPFSEEECRNFESGLRLHGKCFHTIQQKVRTRSVGELVQFYYLWKKSERHDVFANKMRLEKKKYSINPCVTDLMDKFLEEHENNGGGTRDLGNRDRSVSPNVHCLLSTDTKRKRLDSTNSNNNDDIKVVKSKENSDKLADAVPICEQGQGNDDHE